MGHLGVDEREAAGQDEPIEDPGPAEAESEEEVSGDTGTIETEVASHPEEDVALDEEPEQADRTSFIPPPAHREHEEAADSNDGRDVLTVAEQLAEEEAAVQLKQPAE